MRELFSRFGCSGILTVTLATVGMPDKDGLCRGCVVIHDLLDAVALAEIAYEFRSNADDSLCSGGMIDTDGSVFVPDAPSTFGNGRVVVFVPDGCGGSTPASLIRTVAGDCEDGVLTTGAINCGSSPASGTASLSTKQIQFTDAQFDLDGNGRFNERDWVLIQGLLGSAVPADLDRFNVCPESDLNMNGDPTDDQVVAQEDLDAIRAILDAGLDAGELGDCNGDDIVDCTDYAMLPASLNATICDASYKVTLDADLDGDNDAADLAAVQALFPTADVAAPFGILDLSDISTLIAAFTAQTPPADFAPPFGTYDLADLTAFVSAFDTPCP